MQRYIKYLRKPNKSQNILKKKIKISPYHSILIYFYFYQPDLCFSLISLISDNNDNII